MPVPLSCVILTYNEEKNIRRCLESLSALAGEIFVVDSFSNDKTLEITREFTDKIFHRPFKTHTEQWNWAFKNLPFSFEWCLVLDADQCVSVPLRQELELIFQQGMPSDINGYYIIRRQIFLGKWIRFGGYYPKYMLKLFKAKEAACDEKELVDHRFYVRGKLGRLKYDFIEENKNEDDIVFWLEKHLKYVDLKAKEILLYRQKRQGWLLRTSFLGSPDQRVLWLTDFYYCLPLYLRPFLYFIWRYFILLGFLDGPKGFLFHFLQGFRYRLIIDVKIGYLQKKRLS